MIVVTGYADLDGTIAALREGVADYILKPVNPNALRSSLNRIQARRRIAHELHSEQELVDQIFRMAEAIVLILDTHCRVQKFNPYLTKVAGWQLEEVLGLDWCDTFIHSADRDMVRQYFKQTLAGLETHGIVNGIVTKAGRTLQVRWSNTTLKDEAGRVVAVLAVGLDVTEVVEAQERVLQSERLAAIGETMTALAHESRNSLQRIQASTEILELELEGHEQALADLRSIRRATSDLHGLLEELRSFAAPINLQLEACDLPSIWRQAWQYLHAHRGWEKAVLREEVHISHTVHSLDKQRMGQVFRNLFENSLAACSDGAQIVVCLQPTGPHGIEISVADNGSGMTQEQRARMFEAFYTTKPTGTGLGLPIVRRIVEAHQGSIGVDEKAASGTKIIIQLPVEPPQAPPST